MIPTYHYKGFEIKWPHPGRFGWSGVAGEVLIRSVSFIGVVEAIDEHLIENYFQKRLNEMTFKVVKYEI